ncbi:MAG: hypothetical protein ACJ760_05345 [Thermoleophilaceae bacterium]
MPAWRVANAQPRSEIEYDAPDDAERFHPEQTVRERAHVMPPAPAHETHVLTLDATT